MRKLILLLLVVCTQVCTTHAQTYNSQEAQQWYKDVSNDPMTSTPVEMVLKTSVTQEEFSTAYHSLILAMRHTDHGLSMSFMVKGVEFQADPKIIQIRLDNEPAETYAYYFARPGDFRRIDIPSGEDLVQRIRKARNMLVRVGFYAEGTRVYLFHVDNCPLQP